MLLIALALILSGISSLLYEVACSRLLMHVVGATTYSISTVLAAFMLGLGLGSVITGQLATKIKQPLKAYALCELGIALCAAITPWVAERCTWMPLPISGFGAIAITALISFLMLLIPAGLMGATLPLVASYFQNMTGSSKRLATAYAINAAGAVSGSALAGFVLMPQVGLSLTLYCAAGVSIAASILLLCVAPSTARNAIQTEHEPSGDIVPMPIVVVLAAATGLISMILEVAFSRFFTLLLGSSTYSFAAVLSVVLAAVAAGSGLSATLLDSLKSPLRTAGLYLLLAAFWISGSLFLLHELPWTYAALSRVIWQATGSYSFDLSLAIRAILVFLVVFVPAAMIAAVFPLCIKLLSVNDGLPKQFSAIYLSNTVAAVVGAWLAGFVLIPMLTGLLPSGIQATLAGAAAALAGLAFVLVLRDHDQLRKKFAAAAALLVVIPIVAVSQRPWLGVLMTSGITLYSPGTFKNVERSRFLRSFQESSSGPELLFYREGLNTTVTVVRDAKSNTVFLKNDGKTEASAPADPTKHSESSSLSTQVLLGELPVLLHPGKPERALVIGYGSGVTVGSLAASTALKHVLVAEIEPAVYEADRFFSHVNNRPLQNLRVTAQVADARRLLAAEQEPFDVIVSQPADPWVNGSTDLFTREFWMHARKSLAPDGVFCQWIQLYSITPEYLGILCRTFASVFPHTMVFHPEGGGEIILLGSAKPWSLDAGKVEERLQNEAVQADLARIGLNDARSVFDTRLLDDSQFARYISSLDDKLPYNTDDNLLTEFSLPQQLFEHEATIDQNLQALENDTPDAFRKSEIDQ